MPRVLVVDDHIELRLLFLRGLRRAGHEVTTAENGQAALASIQTDRPDLIILDVFMPVMSGPEFLEHVRDHPFDPPIPVLLLSAVGESPEVEYAMTLGPAKFLRKGEFTMEQLMDVVKELTPAGDQDAERGDVTPSPGMPGRGRG